MKVLVNGGINLSELDGGGQKPTRLKWDGHWDGKEHGDDPSWDAVEPSSFTTY